MQDETARRLEESLIGTGNRKELQDGASDAESARANGPGAIFLLGVASGISGACCAPVVVGVVAMSALAASMIGALGLGLAYVFGMVFPLLLAALFWDQTRLGDRLTVLRSVSQLRIGARVLPVADVLAGGMFVAIGAVALWLATTGQSTYTPDVLVGWNRWSTGIAGDAAAALRSVPVAAQAIVLTLMVTGIGAAVYTAWRRGPQS
jgi:cytochrome c-type biogenesis protein